MDLKSSSQIIPGDWVASFAVIAFQGIGMIKAPHLETIIHFASSFLIVLFLLNIRTFFRNTSLTGAVAVFLVSSSTLAAELTQPDDPYLLWRLAGALIGGICYPAIKKESTLRGWLTMAFVGTACGTAGARYLFDWSGWPEVRDYHYLSGFVAGVVSWTVLVSIHKIAPPLIKDLFVSFLQRIAGGNKP